MNIKALSFAVVLGILSCNTKAPKTTDTTESTGRSTAPSKGVDDQKKLLNEQSRACISLMNSLEEDLNAANASHDSQAASAIQSRIDSAAKENVMIGQKLLALENN